VIDHPGENWTRRIRGPLDRAILYPYVADRSGLKTQKARPLGHRARFPRSDQIAALPDLSTSPMVTFTGSEGNQTITLPMAGGVSWNRRRKP